jgi:hypothetical protein
MSPSHGMCSYHYFSIGIKSWDGDAKSWSTTISVRATRVPADRAWPHRPAACSPFPGRSRETTSRRLSTAPAATPRLVRAGNGWRSSMSNEGPSCAWNICLESPPVDRIEQSDSSSGQIAQLTIHTSICAHQVATLVIQLRTNPVRRPSRLTRTGAIDLEQQQKSSRVTPRNGE